MTKTNNNFGDCAVCGQKLNKPPEPTELNNYMGEGGRRIRIEAIIFWFVVWVLFVGTVFLLTGATIVLWIIWLVKAYWGLL